MTVEVLQAAAELAGHGEPFVLATVTWRRGPSSGQAGAKALIRSDGRLEGWIGGACAQPAVVSQALASLADGEPRLVFLGPASELPAREREGIVTMPVACGSEGALELYLEPVLGRPHLVVIGRSPAVDTLASLARTLDWDVVVRAAGADLDAAGVGPGSFVVVATQGHDDEAALQAALTTPAAYVGLVASRSRSQAVLGYLRDRSVADEQLERVRAPAGLDLGRTTHREIAVAILAELVQRRATSAPAHEPPRPPDATATDPVCGMAVNVEGAPHHARLDGEGFFFCCAGCRDAFLEQPAAHRAGNRR